jgi:response regulator of citrate/malate metabolism
MSSNKVTWAIFIDDDDIHNMINRKIIERINPKIEIFVCKDGNEAIQLFEELKTKGYAKKKGIILLDIRMPNINGFEFIDIFNRRFKSTFSHTTVYPLSSSNHVDDMVKMKKFGVEMYLLKPLTLNIAEAILT